MGGRFVRCGLRNMEGVISGFLSKDDVDLVLLNMVQVFQPS